MNSPAIIRPTRDERERGEREGLTDQEDVDESTEHGVNQNGANVLEEDALRLHVEARLEDDDGQQEQREQRGVEPRALFFTLLSFSHRCDTAIRVAQQQARHNAEQHYSAALRQTLHLPVFQQRAEHERDPHPQKGHRHVQ